MQRLALIILLFVATAPMYSAGQEVDTVGLSLWFRSDSLKLDGSSLVESWYNRYAEDSAWQTTAGQRPSLLEDIDAINGHASLQFDGVNDFMEFAPQTEIRSAIFVVKHIDGNGALEPLLGDPVFDHWHGGSKGRIFKGSAHQNILDGTLYVNGDSVGVVEETQPAEYAIISMVATGPTSASYITNDRNASGRYWDGEYVEVLIYDSILTDSSRMATERALRNRYNPDLDLGDDINLTYGFCDTVVYAEQAWFNSYIWSDGSTADSLLVTDPGMYSLTVTNLFGYSSTDTIAVNFPTSSWGIDTTICLGDTIDLELNLASAEYTYQWQDGSTSDSFEVSEAGDYAVTVSDTLGCFLMPDTINVTIDSLALKFSLTEKDTMCAGGILAPQSGAALVDSYSWSTGATAASIAIVTSDEYRVTVSNVRGCLALDTSEVHIAGLVPSTAFSAPDVCHNVPANFTDLTVPNGGDPLTAWNWNFGDGTSSDQQNETHTYANPGKYEVTFYAEGLSECGFTVTDSIEIHANPAAGFAVAQGCVDVPYSFLDTSEIAPGDPITNWEWRLGDGTDTTLQAFEYSYNSAANYSVELKVTSANGCQDSVTNSVEIVNESFIPQNLYLDDPVDNLVTTVPPTSFSWLAAENVLHYKFQISSTTDFSDSFYEVDTSAVALSNLNIGSTQELYWRVTGYNVCLDSTASSIRRIEQLDVTDGLGLSMWLRSDSIGLDGSDLVMYWPDQVAVDSAWQDDLSKRPVLTDPIPELNAAGAVSFDGSNDFMQFVPKSQIRTAIILAKHNTGSGDLDAILGDPSNSDFHGGENGLLLKGSANPNVLNGSLYINGDSTGVLAALQPTQYTIVSILTSGPVQATYLGNDRNAAGRYWDGEYVEVLFFDSLLTDSERVSVEQYMRHRYCPPLDMGPDIDIAYGFCDTVIDATAEWYTDYVWSTGDTTASLVASHTGTYGLTVTDIFGYTSQDEVSVTYPAYSWLSDTTMCLGDVHELSPGLSMADYVYAWQDGSSAASYTMEVAGNYSVSISDSLGCSLRLDTIHLSLDSMAAYTSLLSNDTLCAGDLITLNTGPELVDAYLWSSGQTTASIVVSVSADYIVTVSNDRGCSNVDTSAVHISGQVPDVNMTFDHVCDQVSAQFMDQTIPTGSDPLATWQWHFGDGDSSAIQSPEHRYDSVGVYQVSLYVEAISGCGLAISDSITVFALPTADFTVTQGCIEVPYLFEDQSTAALGDSLENWQWNLGDGVDTTEQHFSYTYDSANDYNIELVVSTSLGCYDTLSQSLTVVATASVDSLLELTEPSDQFVTPSIPSIFGWLEAENVVDYKLELATDEAISNVVAQFGTTSLNVSGIQAGISDEYFWRVTGYNVCRDEVQSEVRSIRMSPIDSTNGATLWLRSDDLLIEEDAVLSWYNLSGQDSAFQLLTLQQPTYTGTIEKLSGYGAVEFDGTDDFMEFATRSNIRTAIMLVKHHTGLGHLQPLLGDPSVADFHGGDNGKLLKGVAHDGGKVHINGEEVFYLDATQPTEYAIISIQPTTTVQASYLTNDRNATGRFWDGEYVEVLLFDSLLSEEQREGIEQYLRFRYTPPVDLGPTIDIPYGFCDTTLSGEQPWFTNYLWSTGDTTSTLSVSSTGQYALTVTDIFGYQSDATVFVNYPDYAWIQDSTICVRDTVNLSPGLPVDSYEYVWQDGSTDELFYMTHAGSYAVTISDSIGCRLQLDSIDLTLDSLADRVSLADAGTFCAGDLLGLTAGDELVSNYQWSTGASTSTIPALDPIDYTLTVTNDRGCVGIDTISVTISGQVPEIAFNAPNVCDNVQAEFTDQSIATPGDPISTWLWEFGDGTTSTDQHSVHTYDTTGRFGVTLYAEGQSGCGISMTDTIEVYANPTAHFELVQGCRQVEFEFNDSSMAVANDDLILWAWRYGDGSEATEQHPTHEYEEAGNYEVELVVGSTLGCLDSLTKTLEIVESASVPSTLLLNYPPDGVVLAQNPSTFDWEAGLGLTDYLVELATDSAFNNVLYSQQSTQENVIPDDHGNTGNLKWRVTGYNVCRDSVVSETRDIQLISPSDDFGATYWLRSDQVELDSLGAIRSWNNMLSSDSAWQLESDLRPSYLEGVSQLNGHQAIIFDGQNDVLEFVQTSDIQTIVMIIKHHTGAGDLHAVLGHPTLAHFHGGSDGNLFKGSASPNLLDGTVRVNGVPNDPFDVLQPTTYTILGLQMTGPVTASLIGSDRNASARFWDGEYVELMFFDEQLDDAEITSIEQYMRLRYAPAVDLGRDMSIEYGYCDTVISAVQPWFTNYLWSTGDTTGTIAIAESGHYAVTATDLFGYTSFDDIYVNYAGQITLEDLEVCTGDTLYWLTGLSELDYDHLWSDGDTLNAHFASGDATYGLTIVDSLECTFTIPSVSSIEDRLAVEVSFGTGDTSLCSGNQVRLSSGDEGIVVYNWSNGASTSSIIVEQTSAYSLTVTNDNGCVGISDVSVEVVGEAPTVDFDWTLACEGYSVSFEDLSTASADNTLVTWNWTIGSIQSNGQQFNYVFDTAGTYQVRLSAFTDVGCQNHAQRTVEVHATPVSQPYVVSEINCSNQVATFSDSSNVSIGQLVDYSWIFVEGTDTTSFNGVEPFVTFTNPGRFDFQLIVLSDDGCRDTAQSKVEIAASPTADFLTDDVCLGEDIELLDNSVGNIVDRFWLFEGEIFDLQSFAQLDVHDPGLHEITLEIHDLNGCESEVTKSVLVRNLPFVDIHDTSYCVNTAHQLSQNSFVDTGSIATWEWSMINLETNELIVLNGQAPKVTFESSGNYYTTLEVTDYARCVSSVADTIIVNDLPETNFEMDPAYGLPPLEVSFMPEVFGLNYQWDFGGADTSSNEQPTHLFEQEGDYQVQVLVTNDAGCSDSSAKLIRVRQPVIDVAVVSMKLNNDEDYVRPIVTFLNQGTVDIENVQLQLESDGHQIVMEQWEGLLESGASVQHEFQSQLSILNGEMPAELCVNLALIMDETDLDNNRICEVNANLEVSRIAPNPVKDELYFRVISSTDQDVSIYLVNVQGQISNKVYEGTLSSGITEFEWPTLGMSSGDYKLVVIGDEEVKYYHIVKL